MRFLLGFGLLYGVLALLAEVDATGRLGLVILAAVLLTALVVEHALARTGVTVSLRNLGFGRPAGQVVLAAVGIGAVLQVSYPLVATTTGAAFTLKPGWPWLLLGIFAFHGLAEELVWRGYAFRRLRAGRSFRAAVVATMPLLAATHLPVVISSGVLVGTTAMVVAAVTSWPLASLFEAGRRTIWAPAILHTAIDSFKVVSVPADVTVTFSLTVAALSLTVPLLALAVPRTTTTRSV